MKQKNLILLPSIVALVIVFGYGYRIVKSSTVPATIQAAVSPTPVPHITFPTGNETLIKGQTYQISWVGGKIAEALFLSNVAMQETGFSASLVDRKYDLANTVSYAYTIPSDIPDGEYMLQIAELNSNKFTITSE